MCHCLKLPFVAVQWKLPARNASWKQAISSGRLDWRRRDLRGPSDYNSSDKWQSLAKQFVSRLRAEKKNHRNLNLERFCRSVCLIWAPKHIKKHFDVKSAYSSVEVCRLCWWFLTFSKEFFLNEIFQWIEFNELELLKITETATNEHHRSIGLKLCEFVYVRIATYQHGSIDILLEKQWTFRDQSRCRPSQPLNAFVMELCIRLGDILVSGFCCKPRVACEYRLIRLLRCESTRRATHPILPAITASLCSSTHGTFNFTSQHMILCASLSCLLRRRTCGFDDQWLHAIDSDFNHGD